MHLLGPQKIFAGCKPGGKPCMQDMLVSRGSGGCAVCAGQCTHQGGKLLPETLPAGHVPYAAASSPTCAQQCQQRGLHAVLTEAEAGCDALMWYEGIARAHRSGALLRICVNHVAVPCRNSGDELQLLEQLFLEVVEQPQQLLM